MPILSCEQKTHYAELSWFNDIYELGKIHRTWVSGAPHELHGLREVGCNGVSEALYDY